MLTQRQQQKLLQKLSPQQIQLMKLFEVPTSAIEQRIKEELEANPALDEGKEDDEERIYQDAEREGDVKEDAETEEQEPTRDEEYSETEKEQTEYSLSDFVTDDIPDDYVDDSVPDYRLFISNKGYEHKTSPPEARSETDFHEYLISQLGLQNLDERQFLLGRHIIGNIDDAGYLAREIDTMIDDILFLYNINTTKEEITEILRIIQSFEPAGVGAKNLQECLLLQLARKDRNNETIRIATEILQEHFLRFSRKHYEKIRERMQISEDMLKLAIDEILKLNPKPGLGFADNKKTTEYIIPDYIIRKLADTDAMGSIGQLADNEADAKQGNLELTLNTRNTPNLHINKRFIEIIEDYKKSKGKNKNVKNDAIIFAKQKIDAAKWFIDAIKQRENTLLKVMTAIMEFQKEYFLTGDETRIRPMRLKDIAEKINMDVSTISRVTSDKYVQTDYGTFLLKKFFSESMPTETGSVSTLEIKKILKDCIEGEDKKSPLTDDELEKILKAKGYNVARRTITNYRKKLGIPPGRLRREI